jgi:glycosyltransferase involved in cell wall biosynthesis
MIAAMPSIIKQQPNIRLLLVGGGPQEENLKAQVKTLALEKYIIFTGRVPHKEVGAYYSLVDLLIYPRKAMRLTELVTPLKPLEAMAQGKICLSSNVGGHHELIKDGENGYLFKANDVEDLVNKVSEILNNKQKWNDIVIQGRHFVETQRNWQESVSKYIPVYKALMKI